MDQPPKMPPPKLTLVPNTGTGVTPTPTHKEFVIENFDRSRFSRLRDRTSERAGSGYVIGGVGVVDPPDAPTPAPFDATNFPRFRERRRERDAIIDAAWPVVPEKKPT